MRKDWATGRNFRRGWLGQLGAWAALLGFLFAATGSGMPLPAAMAAPGDAVLCHAQDGRMAAPAGEASSTDVCCLFCQAAQLADGAVPPQHFTLPTESAVRLTWPGRAEDVDDGAVRRFAQARAPPFV